LVVFCYSVLLEFAAKLLLKKHSGCVVSVISSLRKEQKVLKAQHLWPDPELFDGDV